MRQVIDRSVFDKFDLRFDLRMVEMITRILSRCTEEISIIDSLRYV